MILKGRNDDEIIDLVEFVIAKGIDISFIEEMPLGYIDEHSREESYMSSEAIIKVIEARYPLMSSSDTTSGPSRYYRLQSGGKTRIGFISPHSHNFCSTCNRVRVTAEGRLLLCLGNEHSVHLMETLADALTSIDYYLESMEENKPIGDGVLDVAEESVHELGYPIVAIA